MTQTETTEIETEEDMVVAMVEEGTQDMMSREKIMIMKVIEVEVAMAGEEDIEDMTLQKQTSVRLFFQAKRH